MRLEVKWGGARGGGVELEVKKGGTKPSNKFAAYIPLMSKVAIVPWLKTSWSLRA